MRSLLVLAVLAAIGGWVGVRALPTGNAEAQPAAAVQAQQIQSVTIDGRGLPLADLRAVLTSRPGDMLDNARLAHDRAALQAELASRGHLAAKVEPASVTFAASGGAFVMFRIAQGPIYKVRSVNVIGATARDAVVTVLEGDDAIPSRFEHARQALADALANRSKPATVTLATHVDHAASAVDLELRATR